MTRCLFQILVCTLCCLLPQTRVSAAFAPVEAAPDGERFLFIVDMSEDMEDLQGETEATVYDMIGTGLYGQIHSGDTYGIWTFNKDTYAGRFPMQIWDPRRSAQLGAIAAAYLSGAPYEKSSDVQQMMSKLGTVISGVSNLNVFIISDGGTSIRGTPFDKAINAEYKNRRRERKSAKRPFVTTLIVRKGWITTNTVTIAGEPFMLPPRVAPEPPQKKAEPPAPAQAAVTTPKKQVIITSPTVQAPAPVPPKQDPPIPAASAPKILAATEPAANAAPHEESKPDKEPAPPARQLVAQSNILAAPANETAPREPVPPPAKIATPSPPVAAPPSPEPSPAPTAVVNTPVVKQVSDTSLARGALEAMLPEPIPVAARESNADQAEPETRLPTPIQSAALPLESGGNGKWLIAFGGFLLASALCLAFVAIRSRPAATASLITQSMNRR